MLRNMNKSKCYAKASQMQKAIYYESIYVTFLSKQNYKDRNQLCLPGLWRGRMASKAHKAFGVVEIFHFFIVLVTQLHTFVKIRATVHLEIFFTKC